MLQRVQKLPQPVRVALFIGIALAFLAVIVLITILVGIYTVQNTPRLEAVPLTADYAVEEYVMLPDEDAYPATFAVDQNGTLYTGSYATGVIWAINTQKELREIPNTREKIGSVSAIVAAPDNSFYILDRISPLFTQGAKVWKLDSADTLTLVKDFTGIQADILQLPDDIAVDNVGNIYISDRGADNNHDIIYRLASDGTEGVWWQSPPVTNARVYAPTGLAYNREKNALYITDFLLDLIYEVDIAEDGSAGENKILYDRRQGDEETPPGFDGISVTDDGIVFVSGLGNNRIGMYDPNTGLMTYVAGQFRSPADVIYDPLTQRIFVANWDQRALLPSQVLFVDVETKPHLPFAIDVVTRR